MTRLEGKVAELEAKLVSMTAELTAKIDALLGEVTKRDEEIARLKTQIDKNSTNSSKPPSSNGFKKIPNNREKSGKKQGGQEGHSGSTLVIPNNLSELVSGGKAEYKVISKVTEGKPNVSDWQIDLKIVTIYTEIRRKPSVPPSIRYGDNVKVLTVYLSVIGLIAVKRLGAFFRDISGGLLTVSKAAIQKFTHDAAQSADMEPLITDLLNGRVMSVDETPVKTTERENIDKTVEQSEKTTLSAYIRTYSNATTTVLTANAHKNLESVEHDNILPRFFGIVIQDYESKFLRYGTDTGLCGAHLSRELKGFFEINHIAWAEEVRQFFRKMNDRKAFDRDKGIKQCHPDLLCGFENEYDELVSGGQVFLSSLKPKSYIYKTLASMVKRLSLRKSEYMLFMRDYEVPYTNKLAERDLRHCKTKQKVSGCYHSWKGLVDYCKLRSAIDTARKRGRSLLDAISELFSQECTAGQ